MENLIPINFLLITTKRAILGDSKVLDTFAYIRLSICLKILPTFCCFNYHKFIYKILEFGITDNFHNYSKEILRRGLISLNIVI